MTDRPAVATWSGGHTVSARRTVWGVADQAIWSLGNLLLVALAAASLDAEAFGAFGSILGIELVLLGAVSAFLYEPVVMVHQNDRHRHSSRVLRQAALLGSSLSGLMLTVGYWFSAPTDQAIFGFALALTPVAMFECARGLLHAAGRTRAVSLLDLTWTALTIALVPVATMAERSLLLVPAAWGAAAVPGLAGALIILAHSGHEAADASEPPGRTDIPLARMGSSFAVESVVTSASAQLSASVVGSAVSLTSAGALRLAQTAFGPLNVLATGLRLTIVPQLRDRHERSESVTVAIRHLLVILVLLTVATTMALYAVPTSWIRQLVGDLWDEARRIVPMLGLVKVVEVTIFACAVHARSRGIISQTRRLRVAGGALSMFGVFVGGWVWGAQGAVAGLGAGLVVTLPWWLVLGFRTAVPGEAESPLA